MPSRGSAREGNIKRSSDEHVVHANIDTDIMKVKSNLSRADLLIRAFMRKMATDKIIMSTRGALTPNPRP